MGGVAHGQPGLNNLLMAVRVDNLNQNICMMLANRYKELKSQGTFLRNCIRIILYCRIHGCITKRIVLSTV